MAATLTKAKFKATSIHLAISLVVLLVLTAFIQYAWYPEPYFATAGGWQGIRITGGACLALGPLLTLIIFNPTKSKRAITLDYSIIVSAQIAALAWGIYAIHSQRPIAIVYHHGSFEAVVQETLSEQAATFDLNKLKEKSEERPPLLFAREPTEEEIPTVATWSVLKGVPEYYLAFLYDGLSLHMAELAQENKDHQEKLQSTPDTQDKLRDFLKANNLKQDDTLLALFKGSYGDAWLVISNEGKLLGAIEHPFRSHRE